MSDALILLQTAVRAHQSGDAATAEAGYLAVLAVAPGEPNALHLLGLLLCARGETGPGLASIERALATDPAMVPALFNRANVLHGLGRLEDARQGYLAALRASPDFVPAHHNLARVLLALELPGPALLASEVGLAVAPREPGLLIARGDALQELDRPAEARDCYDQVLAAAPEDAVALTNRANADLALGRQAAALAGYDAALRARPDHANAHYNRARAVQEGGAPEAALAGYDQALAAEPGHLASAWNASMCRLLLGDFSQWPQQWGEALGGEALAPSQRRVLPAPAWDGTGPLAGRRLLVHIDQGLGDTLQFCRFAPRLSQRMAEIVLEVQAPLVRLLQRSLPQCHVLAQGEALPPVDCECNLMNLPGLFGLTVATIPAGPPYLLAAPAAVAAWRSRLAVLPGRKIGLVWAGNPRLDQRASARIDRRRSMPLAQLAALADIPDTCFVSLQKGASAVQLSAIPFGCGVFDWTRELHNFDDTASLVSALDLVISVDTSVAHLAGGLGVPVWLLNRFDTCWRWLLGRDDSPWYPTLRQFRQPEPGDWDSVVQQVREALLVPAA